MQGEPPNMDGLFFDLLQKREKARVYTQFIYSIVTLVRDLDDLRIRGSQIWGWDRCVTVGIILFGELIILVGCSS